MSDMSFPPQTPGGTPPTGPPPTSSPAVPPAQATPPTGAAQEPRSTSTYESEGVRERASGAASHAGEAGREVAQDAKERAGDVAHEAKERARNLMDQARSEVTDQASTQQERLAAGIRHLGAELSQMSRASDDPGYATELAERGSQTAERLADWFERREPGDVLREVQDFARRRPGAFLAVAAGAGLVVGRMLRGAKEAGEMTPTRRTSTTAAPPPPVMSTSDVPAATDVPTAYPTTAMGTSVPPTTGGASHVHKA